MGVQNYKLLTVPAAVAGTPGVVHEGVSGSVFYCVLATAALVVRPQDQGPITVQTGRTFGTPVAQGGRPFGALTFENSSGSDIDITFMVSDEAFDAEKVTFIDTTGLVVNTAMKNDIAECVLVAPAQFAKTVSSAGTPEALTASASYFRKAIAYAYKTVARGANTGNIRIGVGSGAGQQLIQMTPGDEYVIEAPTGARMNFQNWYIDADNNGDGVVMVYS